MILLRYKEGIAIKSRIRVLVLVCIISLGIFVPLFEGNSINDWLWQLLTGDSKDVIDFDEEPSGGEVYHYWTAPPNSFGIKSMKFVNQSYFWKLFNKHSSWTVEGWHLDQQRWVENLDGIVLNDYLNVSKTQIKDKSYEKIVLNFTSPYTTRYRFNFEIDLGVDRFVNRTGEYEYLLNYAVPNTNEIYSVFFNWSDIVNSDWSDKVTFKHGFEIRNIGGEDQSFFYFLITTNVNLTKGKWYEIDPTFGADPSTKVDDTNIGDWTIGNYYTAPSSGVVDNITAWVQRNNVSLNVTFAIYEYVDNSVNYAGNLIATTETKNYYSLSAGEDWNVFNFSDPKPGIVEGVKYYLIGTFEGEYAWCRLGYGSNPDSIIDARESGHGGTFEDPWEGETSATNQWMIYASYTENATVGEGYTFGRTNVTWDGSDGIENRYDGSYFNTGDYGGTCDAIYFYPNCVTGYVGNVTAGIYEYTDYSSDYVGNMIANGQTEVKEVTTSIHQTWTALNFSEPKPVVQPNTNYYIILHGQAKDGVLNVYTHSSGDTSIDRYKAWNPTMDSPITGETAESHTELLYCTYHNYSHITDNWKYCKKVTINHSYVDGNLTNFPILVHNTSSNLSHARADGYDFVFMNETNATKYNHEIERFNRTSGELIAWVNITDLRSDVDTIVYLWYGNATTGTQENVADTWDSNYVGVWHMQSSYNGSGIDDSTINDWFFNKTNTPYEDTGMVGYAQTFNRPDEDFFYRLEPDNWCVNATVTGWWNVTSTDTSDAALISRDYVYGDVCANLDDFQTLRLYWGSNSTYTNERTGNIFPRVDTWYFTGWARDNVTQGCHFYLNNSKPDDGDNNYTLWPYKETVSVGNMGIGTSDAVPGSESRFWNGTIDELRLSNINRSFAWIKTEYETVANSSTFISVGSEQRINNNVPTQTGEDPTNESTNISTTPALYVICTDTDSDTMTATWKSNSSETWTTFATNSSISTGTNITQTNNNFSSPGTTYYWSVNLTDGIAWTNNTYHFTTNNLPTQTGESPTNGSTGINITPPLYIICNDADSNTMTATWKSNSSETWTTFATNSSISTGTNITQTNNNFSNYSIIYYWSVNLTDGTVWTNNTYHFTTEVINTSVDTISPYQVTTSTVNLTASAEHNNYDNVTLWYRYSSDNSSWANDSNWWNASWTYRKKITIDSSYVDANLTNFPILVSTTDTNLSSAAQNDGDDIVFTNATGTKLNHEIELFNGTTGQLVAWVNVTSLSGSTDTEIYMYYGNGTCGTQENVAGTWDSNFYGVYHMADTNASLMDSTGNSNDGTLNGHYNSSTGQIGNAITFDGHQDYASIPSMNEKDNLTVTIWSMFIDPAPASDYGIHIGVGDILSSQGWGLMRRNSSSRQYVIAVYYGGSWSNIDSPVPIDIWRFEGFSWQSNASSFWMVNDTVSSTHTPTGGLKNSNWNLVLAGRYDGQAYNANVTIDEVRASRFQRNQSWVKTEYNTSFYKSSFISVGSEEAWFEWDNSSQNPDTGSPWSWDFDFPNGTGYYEFYSIGNKSGSTNETVPSSADASCHYNTAPTQNGEVPTNGSTDVSLTPALNVTVDDANDDTLTAYWYSNSSGSWLQFASNSSIITSNGTVNIVQTNSNFSSYSTTYYWSVNLSDGTDWTNQTYHFTTAASSSGGGNGGSSGDGGTWPPPPKKITTSQDTMDDIEQLYGVTLDDPFYATDTNGDDIVDTFTDPNGVLTSINSVGINGNVSFLLSIDDDTIPEFFWDADADTATTISYVLATVTGTYIDPVEETVTFINNVDKGDWIYMEAIDQYLPDEFPNYNLIVKTSDNRIISLDMIWRENGKIFVLDDPDVQYVFVYGYDILPASFEPPNGTAFNITMPTIIIAYQEQVQIISAIFGPLNITKQITSSGNKIFTYTLTTRFPSGTYTLSVTVEDADNNSRTDKVTYIINIVEEQPVREFPWLTIAAVGIVIALIAIIIFLRKKKNFLKRNHPE